MSQKIKELIKKNQPTQKVKEARELQSRIAFHTDPESSNYADTHFSWVRDLGITDEKIETYKALFKAPIASHKLANEVFSRASRIFKSNDKKIVPTKEDDNVKASPEKYNLFTFFESIVFSVMKTDPMSYILLDKNTSENGESGEPFPFIVTIDSVLHVKESFRLGRVYVDEILFKNGDSFFFYDAERWAKYSNDGKLIDESNHNLKTCPAFNIWHEFLRYSNMTCKNYPIGLVLSDLERYLLMYYGGFNAGLTDAFPMYWMYAEDESAKRYGGNGQKEFSSKDYPYPQAPRAVNKKPLKLGAVIEVDRPKPNMVDDMRNPLGRIESDVDATKNLDEKIETMAKEIVSTMISGNLSTDLSNDLTGNVTATQIKAIINSRADFLDRFKANIEKSFTMVLNGLIAVEKSLPYEDRYLVDLGNDFFRLEEAEAMKIFAESKKAGIGTDEMLSIYQELLHSKHAKNHKQLRRSMILSYSEPLPYYSLEEAENFLSEIDFWIKTNFSKLVTIFENQIKMPISEYKPEQSEKQVSLEFGEFLITSYQKKDEQIKTGEN